MLSGIDPIVIDHFAQDFAFLSNFSHSPVRIRLAPNGETLTVATVEHAFNACKTLDPDERRHIATAPSPAEAKRRGRRCALRPDWDERVRYEVMLALLRQKFAPGSELARRLLNTGPETELVEGNSWGDRHWGAVAGRGENHLGRLLMRVRDELRSH